MDIKLPEYPDHLRETVSDAEKLQESIIASTPKLEQPMEQIKKEDPRTEKQYTFQLNWTDGRGKVWAGAFTNKILNLREHQMVGVLRARLASGLPIEALDTMTVEINLMVAHMTFSLVKRPDWAKDLQELENVRILQELYQEVLRHEATFLGYRDDQDQSENES